MVRSLVYGIVSLIVMTMTVSTHQADFFHPSATLCHSMPFPFLRMNAGFLSKDYSLDYLCMEDRELLPEDETDQYIAESSFAQSFILRSYHYPILHMTVCEALYYAPVSDGMQFQEGDFIIDFNRSPFLAPLTLLHPGFAGCLNYFFSFPEVKRLLCISPATQYLVLLLSLGFQENNLTGIYFLDVDGFSLKGKNDLQAS